MSQRLLLNAAFVYVDSDAAVTRHEAADDVSQV